MSTAANGLRGRIKTRYRRGDFWPHPLEQIALHRLMLGMPLPPWHRLLVRHRRRVDSNVRAAL